MLKSRRGGFRSVFFVVCVFGSGAAVGEKRGFVLEGSIAGGGCFFRFFVELVEFAGWMVSPTGPNLFLKRLWGVRFFLLTS